MTPTDPDPCLRLSDTPDVMARFRGELDLVDINARQLFRRLGSSSSSSATIDDLRSFGQEGLLQAARAFDESRGVPFRRWANLRVRGAILDGVRKWGALPRRVYREIRAIAAADAQQEAYLDEHAASPATTPEAADKRLSSYLAGIATAMAMGAVGAAASDETEAVAVDASPEEQAASRELIRRVRDIMRQLPEAERALIERHYFEDQTLDQAATSLGLSKSWGSRLHARAIDTIARELRRSDGV